MAHTFRELDELRRDLRAALERNPHVLNAFDFRRIARVIARLDTAAAEIRARMEPIFEGRAT